MTKQRTFTPAHLEFETAHWIGVGHALKVAEAALRPLALGRFTPQIGANGHVSLANQAFTIRMVLPQAAERVQAQTSMSVWIDEGVCQGGNEEQALAMVVRALTETFRAHKVYWPLRGEWVESEEFIRKATPVVARRVTLEPGTRRSERPRMEPVRPTRVTAGAAQSRRPSRDKAKVRKQLALLQAQSMEAAVRGHILAAPSARELAVASTEGLRLTVGLAGLAIAVKASAAAAVQPLIGG